MGLYATKPWFLRTLAPLRRRAVRKGVSPDALTGMAVGASVLAGGALALGAGVNDPRWWLAVPPLVVARLALNALDGAVAREQRSGRPLGAALNEMGDRVSDAATIGAVGFATSPGLAMGAVAASLLASHSGHLSAALGGARDYAGPMGKADRAMVLAVAALAGAVFGSAVPLEVALWVIVAGALATVAVRLERLRRRLSPRAPVIALTHTEVHPPADVEMEVLHGYGR